VTLDRLNAGFYNNRKSTNIEDSLDALVKTRLQKKIVLA
jgi:hypothetical protein